jgi:hypothetical protein
MMALDRDGNRLIDFVDHERDGDGFLDVVAVDTDGDGKLETTREAAG